MLEDNEPHPSTFLSEIKVDLSKYFENASNFLVHVKPLEHSKSFKDDEVPHNDPFLMEYIKGLISLR
jgi:hypothetical protein